MNLICFDLEGPLSPQDNAYELMKLSPNGDKVFEVISYYDDLLTLEERKGYEPGDTLALIVPFLILHNASENNIKTLAAKAGLTGGAQDLLLRLKDTDWQVFCISTSYEQYALHIAQRVGIQAENVASTQLPLDKLRRSLDREELKVLKKAEVDILALYPPTDDKKIKQSLDDFFLKELPKTKVGKAISEVKPRGGRRKVEALNMFAELYTQPLSNLVVIGDSITDSRMLEAVDNAGGLAIAFNANEYALPYATMSLASTSIDDLKEVLGLWPEGHRNGVEKIVIEKEKTGGSGNRGHLHWLSDRKNLDEVLKIHKRIRRLVREEASRLG